MIKAIFALAYTWKRPGIQRRDGKKWAKVRREERSLKRVRQHTKMPQLAGNCAVSSKMRCLQRRNSSGLDPRGPCGHSPHSCPDCRGSRATNTDSPPPPPGGTEQIHKPPPGLSGFVTHCILIKKSEFCECNFDFFSLFHVHTNCSSYSENVFRFFLSFALHHQPHTQCTQMLGTFVLTWCLGLMKDRRTFPPMKAQWIPVFFTHWCFLPVLRTS